MSYQPYLFSCFIPSLLSSGTMLSGLSARVVSFTHVILPNTIQNVVWDVFSEPGAEAGNFFTDPLIHYYAWHFLRYSRLCHNTKCLLLSYTGDRLPSLSCSRDHRTESFFLSLASPPAFDTHCCSSQKYYAKADPTRWLSPGSTKHRYTQGVSKRSSSSSSRTNNVRIPICLDP